MTASGEPSGLGDGPLQHGAAPQAVRVLADNYAWIVAGANGGALVVDPGEAQPVRRALARRGLRLEAILATHHHADHVGGIEALLAGTSDVTVVASGHDVGRCRVPAANRACADGETLVLAGLEVRVLAVPGHTLGAVAYHLPAVDAVFTGDTLFLAGCGRLFEGDAADLWRSLQRLRALPASTRICCAHDYLTKNLRFAAAVLPESESPLPQAADVGTEEGMGAGTDEGTEPASDAGADAGAAGRTAGDASANTGAGVAARPRTRSSAEPWATLGLERQRNPFLRADDPALQRALGQGDAVATFAELRRRRDVFR